MQIICKATKAIVNNNGLPMNMAAAKLLMEQANRAMDRAREANDRKALAKARRLRSRYAAAAATLQTAPQPA